MKSLSLKQKIINISQQDLNYANVIYSKNPKLKLQKLLQSRMKQFNQKSIVMNGFLNIKDKIERKINESQTMALKPHKNRRYKTNRLSYDQVSPNYTECIQKNKKKSHKTQNNLQTIDSMKQRISKSLIKDLLSLTSIQQSLVNKANKHVVKIKLPLTRKCRQVIDYNQCCNLAELRKEEPIFDIKNQFDVTPKLSIQNSNNRQNGLLDNKFKKKQLSINKNLGRRNQKYKSLERKLRLRQNQKIQGYKNCKSERKRLQSLQKSLQNSFSPWEIHTRNQSNPQFTQFVKFFN